MATKKLKTDQQTDQKEILFNNVFNAAFGTMHALEVQYDVNGVVDQIFGKDADKDTEAAKANFRKSTAWYTLSALYDYAHFGIMQSDMDGESSLVIDGADVLQLATSGEHAPSTVWEDTVAMADGRYALDEGYEVMFYKLALLAKVDQRTLRNAISSGELVATKRTSETNEEYLWIENASARRWLLGRRGFRPTVLKSDGQQKALKEIRTPSEFSAYLTKQRELLNADGEAHKLTVFHRAVDAQALNMLEAGVFNLPLDTVFPLADFYQADRKDFLECIMRVFFRDELNVLCEKTPHKKGSKS